MEYFATDRRYTVSPRLSFLNFGSCFFSDGFSRLNNGMYLNFELPLSHNFTSFWSSLFSLYIRPSFISYLVLCGSKHLISQSIACFYGLWSRWKQLKFSSVDKPYLLLQNNELKLLFHSQFVVFKTVLLSVHWETRKGSLRNWSQACGVSNSVTWHMMLLTHTAAMVPVFSSTNHEMRCKKQLRGFSRASKWLRWRRNTTTFSWNIRAACILISFWRGR